MNRIIIEYELRPCMVNGKKALFHRWVDAVDGGLIEREDGSMEMVHPESIKFIDNRIKEYAFPEEA